MTVPSNATTVVVVDDQTLVRQAVVDILSAEPSISVVGAASNGHEAVAIARALEPDVVVMDIRMPEMDGITATAIICGEAERTTPTPRVLVLTTFEEDEYLLAALKAGASGFIGKGAEPEEIVRAVRAVAAGDSLLSPAATRALILRYLESPVRQVNEAALADLTGREREVFLLVARGLSNQHIADALVISPHTAKTHVNRIMVKLRAHDRAQLVIAAYENGLVGPGDH